jgi:DNA-binding Xre family transcriptional regulator
MSLTGEYMRILDEIRTARQWTVSNLTKGIVTERTYYRLLSADSVRTDLFSKLCNKMGINLSELIHYSAFVRKNDSRFKFLFRMHTKYYRDIEPHYQAILVFQDSDEDLNLLLQAGLRRYERQLGIIGKEDYDTYLESLIPWLQDNASFNVYLFLIQLYIQEELPQNPWFSLTDLATRLAKEPISYSALTMAMTIDLLLEMLMKENIHTEATFHLIDNLGQVLTHFPSRFYQMRHYLYQAYQALVQNESDVMSRFLFRFCMNAMYMLDSTELALQFEMIRRVFSIDVDHLVKKTMRELLE